MILRRVSKKIGRGVFAERDTPIGTIFEYRCETKTWDKERFPNGLTDTQIEAYYIDSRGNDHLLPGVAFVPTLGQLPPYMNEASGDQKVNSILFSNYNLRKKDTEKDEFVAAFFVVVRPVARGEQFLTYYGPAFARTWDAAAETDEEYSSLVDLADALICKLEK